MIPTKEENKENSIKFLRHQILTTVALRHFILQCKAPTITHNTRKQKTKRNNKPSTEPRMLVSHGRRELQASVTVQTGLTETL